MVLEEFKLNGEVAILAASGRSWAKDLAAALAEAGAKVILAGQQIESEIKGAPNLEGNVTGMPTDLSSRDDIRNMVRQTISRYGSIDILVNNMNLEFAKPFLEMTDREMSQVMDANFTSTYRCCKAVGEHMLGRRQGKIVNIVSGAAIRGLGNATAYCASMGGVIQLTRSLALEWARDNVRVNGVGFGWMEESFGGGQGDAVARYVPMRRRGRAADIAPLVIFLASNASSYLSGHIYFVDGGVMARA
jgi:NAD(P)-dependent dehydrogenase (short-subunit alcohol dehydrogenase family)